MERMLFAGSFISNAPSAFVVVPVEVPLTTTDTPERGSPFSVLIIPFTVARSCACSTAVISSEKHNKQMEIIAFLLTKDRPYRSQCCGVLRFNIQHNFTITK